MRRRGRTRHAGERVLLAVGRFWRERGRAPSCADVAALVGLRRQTVHETLRRLVRDAYVWADRRRLRNGRTVLVGWSLTGDGRRLCGHALAGVAAPPGAGPAGTPGDGQTGRGVHARSGPF